EGTPAAERRSRRRTIVVGAPYTHTPSSGLCIRTTGRRAASGARPQCRLSLLVVIVVIVLVVVVAVVVVVRVTFPEATHSKKPQRATERRGCRHTSVGGGGGSLALARL